MKFRKIEVARCSRSREIPAIRCVGFRQATSLIAAMCMVGVSSIYSTMGAASGSTLRSAHDRSATKKALIPFTFSQLFPSAGEWGVDVGIAEGFFKRNGLAVQVSSSGSGTTSIDELLSKSVDLAEGGDNYAITAAATGGAIVMVGAMQNAQPYVVVGAKSLTSLRQLKGQTLAVSSATDITAMDFDAVATKAGLNPASVSLVFSPTTGDRFAALESGTVKAAMLLPPYNFEAVNAGYPALGAAAKYVTYPFTEFDANSSWAKGHAKELIDFFKGYLESIKWLYQPSHHAAAIRILVAATGAQTSAVQSSYDFYIKQLKTFPGNGVARTGAVANLIKGMVNEKALASPIPVSKVMDNSYVNAAYKVVK